MRRDALQTNEASGAGNLRLLDPSPVSSDSKGNDRRLSRTGRLQIVLSEDGVEQLEALREVTDAASFAEVVRRALRIYEGLLAEAGSDGEILVRRPSGEVVPVPLHRAL